MKLKKSSLLLSMIASSILLTACNEKETAKTEQNAQPVKQEIANTNEQPKKEEVNQNSDLELAKFNSSVKISATMRNIVKDDKNNEGISISYEIENLSDKPISSIHWGSVYTFNGKLLYSVNLPLVFEKPIQPKSKEVVTETTSVTAIPEENRETVLNVKNNINITIVALELGFVDGSKIVVKQ